MSAPQTSNNKKPAEVKKDPEAYNPASMYESKLALPREIAQDLAAKNLVPRWINGTQFQRDHGFHRSRWVAYKMEKKAGGGMSAYSPDPEGYIRRGDLILAVRTEQDNNNHRHQLKHKANLYKNYEKEKKAELAKHLREAGIKSQVVEGYDQDGGETE